jgi:hypothetical protein
LFAQKKYLQQLNYESDEQPEVVKKQVVNYGLSAKGNVATGYLRIVLAFVRS